jgi:hypothetical protein
MFPAQLARFNAITGDSGDFLSSLTNPAKHHKKPGIRFSRRKTISHDAPSPGGF